MEAKSEARILVVSVRLSGQNSELMDMVGGRKLGRMVSGEGPIELDSFHCCNQAPCSHPRLAKITHKLLPKEACLVQLLGLLVTKCTKRAKAVATTVFTL